MAAAENPAAALREAERLFPGEEQRKAVLQGAGQFLAAIGEYPKAADILREGSGGNAIPQSDLEMVRKTRRAGEIKFSANGAVAALQRYILSLFDQRNGLDSDMAANLLSGEAYHSL